MSSQPISGDQYKTISGGVGTAVISATPATVKKVVVPGTYVGTLELHDAAATTGTSATSAVYAFGLPTTEIPMSLELNTQFKNGIVYEATGTPVMTITWDK